MHSGTGHNNLAAWLILSKTPKLGPVRTKHLLQHLETPEKIINASCSTLRELKTPAASIRWLKQSTNKDIAYELQWADVSDQHVLNIQDSTYPDLLRELHDSPPLLFVKGNTDVINDPQIAIVGSRHPSTDGKNAAFQFAQHLAQAGLVVSSGLAQGIDAQSHKGALSTGSTIAVCATGLDRVYPAEHHRLAQEICRTGALVSEFHPGTDVHKSFFPRRNRLISGLSMGTLVVEASVRSGSLITAQCALEQGREVFAMPGSIHNPMAKGCHKLIKQGAKLVENTTDVLEELQSHLQHLQHGLHSKSENTGFLRLNSEQELAAEYQTLLEVMTYSPMSIDEIIIKTQQKAEDISSMLLILELDGRVNNLGSGRYSRC